MGFSGTIWFLSNLFTVAAVGLFLRARDGEPAPVAPVLVLGLLGALSYSTNLSLWPALLAAGFLLRRPWRQLAAVALSGAAVYVVFFHFFRPLPWHPKPETSHPLVLARYSATYLGNIFSNQPVRAAIMGGLGVAVASAVAAWAVSSRRPALRHRLAPWLALQVYVVGNSLGTAVGRAGRGPRSPLASRYSSLTTLFWIAVLAEVYLLLRDSGVLPAMRRRPERAAAMAGGLAAVLLLPVFHHGLTIYRAYLGNAARQPLAAEAIRRGIPDMQVLRTLTPAPEQIGWVWSFLKANRQVPFDRPALQLPATVGAASVLPPGSCGVRGCMERLEHVTGSVWRVQGWAAGGPHGPMVVVILGGSGKPLARMVTGLPHRPIPGLTEPRYRCAGGAGYVRATGAPEPLRAAVLAPGPSLCLLDAERTVPEKGH